MELDLDSKLGKGTVSEFGSALSQIMKEARKSAKDEQRMEWLRRSRRQNDGLNTTGWKYVLRTQKNPKTGVMETKPVQVMSHKYWYTENVAVPENEQYGPIDVFRHSMYDIDLLKNKNRKELQKLREIAEREQVTIEQAWRILNENKDEEMEIPSEEFEEPQMVEWSPERHSTEEEYEIQLKKMAEVFFKNLCNARNYIRRQCGKQKGTRQVRKIKYVNRGTEQNPVWTPMEVVYNEPIWDEETRKGFCTEGPKALFGKVCKSGNKIKHLGDKNAIVVYCKKCGYMVQAYLGKEQRLRGIDEVVKGWQVEYWNLKTDLTGYYKDIPEDVVNWWKYNDCKRYKLVVKEETKYARMDWSYGTNGQKKPMSLKDLQ